MSKLPCHFVNGLSLIGHRRKLLAKTQCVSIAWKHPQAVIGLVSTTIKSPEKLPRHLGADEKHTHLLGEKAYIPAVAGDGCVLGVSGSGFLSPGLL
jgi:hypothetical protein